MILTLEEFEKFIPNRKTFGLFGYPINHTLSPNLHKYLVEDTEYDADYIAIKVTPNELFKAFNIAKQKLSGVNITIPHKTQIMTFLDYIDQQSLDIGCINTVHFAKDKSYGYNTDIYGFSRCLQQDNIDVENKNVTVLGNGGTSLMVCYYLLTQNANLTIAVRDICKGKALASLLMNTVKYTSTGINVCNLSDTPNNTQIVINCTSVGMFPNIDVSPIQKLPHDCEYVYDVIYNPYSTKLLDMAQKSGIKNSNGLRMLMLQGAKAQNIWQGINFTDTKLKVVYHKLIKHL